MNLSFPSPEFDQAVAGICHGTASEAELRAMNALLRLDAPARDEYLLRVELHTRLASDPDLFAPATGSVVDLNQWRPSPALSPAPPTLWRRLTPALALAASLVLLVAGVWGLWGGRAAGRQGATSAAVAMLTRAVEARWSAGTPAPRVGEPLEPGWLRLESGLAQVVFYSGARVVLEGPAELQLVSPTEAVCTAGRLLAEVPPAAHGFRLQTPQLRVVDLGTAFGVAAGPGGTEVHVFQGRVQVQESAADTQLLGEGQAAAAVENAPLRRLAANPDAFTPLFEFQQRLLAAEALRYEQWQFASAQLNQDPSLVVRLDFEKTGTSDWSLRNLAEASRTAPEASLIGCQPGEGRWREKHALEFQNVNDRVRLAVPGEFTALTLAAWVRVSGLDREFNSLFMCDGFDPGTVHWLIRKDGVLGLTLFGPRPGALQITASPPVVGLDKLGMWLHLAAVVDGKAGQVTHYVNGVVVSQHALKVAPPYRIGPAELGNWNFRSGPNPAPNLIRNLSGTLDEFTLFRRALSPTEIHSLYRKGRPDL